MSQRFLQRPQPPPSITVIIIVTRTRVSSSKCEGGEEGWRAFVSVKGQGNHGVLLRGTLDSVWTHPHPPPHPPPCRHPLKIDLGTGTWGGTQWGFSCRVGGPGYKSYPTLPFCLTSTCHGPSFSRVVQVRYTGVCSGGKTRSQRSAHYPLLESRQECLVESRSPRVTSRPFDFSIDNDKRVPVDDRYEVEGVYDSP